MSPFDIYVAVDILECRVVRLTRGDAADVTVYDDDPIEVALNWEKQGAQWLHVVDLDGAIKGSPINSGVIDAVIGAVGIPVQVAGGVRTHDAISKWLRTGAARVCIGTRSLDGNFLKEAVGEFGNRLLVAVDAKRGEVQAEGWTRPSGASVKEVLAVLIDAGVERIMFTDIERDGTLSGPNLRALDEVLTLTTSAVIASGGVKKLRDVQELSRLSGRGLEGVIIGRALYSGSLKLEEALAAC